MATHTIDLSAEQEHFVNSCVNSGHFASASDVMSAALRLQEQQEREYTERMELLRAAVEQELASGPPDMALFERLQAAISPVARA